MIMWTQISEERTQTLLLADTTPDALLDQKFVVPGAQPRSRRERRDERREKRTKKGREGGKRRKESGPIIIIPTTTNQYHYHDHPSIIFTQYRH
jgi:hypothetical protein